MQTGRAGPYPLLPAKAYTRGLAWFIDLIFDVSIVVAGTAVSYIPALVALSLSGDYGLEGLALSYFIAILAAMGMLLLWWIITAAIVSRWGQTPGKLIMRIRVVGADGDRLGAGWSLLRVLAHKALFHVPAFVGWYTIASDEYLMAASVMLVLLIVFVAGHVWMLFDRDGRSAVDILSRSQVVKV